MITSLILPFKISIFALYLHLRASFLKQQSPSRSEWNQMVLFPSGLWSLSSCRYRFRRQLWADRLLLNPWWPQRLPSAHLQVQWGWGKDRQKKALNLFHLLSLITDVFISLSFLPSFDPILLVPFLTVVNTLHVFCVCVCLSILRICKIIFILLLCFCSLKPSLLSPQSLPWSLLPNSSVKHLKTVTM